MEIKSNGEKFEELVKAIEVAGDDVGLRSTAIQNLREYHTDVSSNEIAFSKELEHTVERNNNLAKSNEFLTGRLAQQPTTPPNTPNQQEEESTTAGLTLADLI